jgi:L-lactate dehydrogenase (cytochrome)
MTRSAHSVASPRVVCIQDFRPLARRRLPKAVFDYLDGGAEGEVTLLENCRAFAEVTFRPRHAVDVTNCDLRTRVLGLDLSMPFLLAPVGYSRLMHPDGEAGAARAAGNAGTAYILSTISGHKLEDVKAASSGPVFYQLYLMGARESAEAAITRAQAAGFSALVVTIDTAVSGMRERDYRNGMKELLTGSVFEKLPFVWQIAQRPRWLINFWLDGGLPKLPNVVIPGKGPMELLDVNAALSQSGVTWEDMKWIRTLWSGPIVIKGVLPEIVAAVSGQAEVLMDGGIRRGTDIAKAICLGARAVLGGRAYAYGLAAAGQAGVARALEILRADLERTLKLLGCRSITELNRSYVDVPRTWHELTRVANL